ncbi:MAG: homoserine dehydrogenase, partial [Opitutaceae bacterium]
IYGILNGTCNYILTKMEELDAPYAGVLAEAKRLGYAEAQESLDVEGWDTAHKASILAWLAHGVWVRPGQMIVEGIERITPADFKNAAALGYGIKLLGIITRDLATDEIVVRVHPTLLPEGTVLAQVSGVFNAISVTGDVVGTTVYIGRGAGQDATASAVISDIADAVGLILHGKGAHLMGEERPALEARARLAPPERIRGRYYVRLSVADRPGVLARVATIMARNRISIASVIQGPSESSGQASLVLTTHESDERSMRGALRSLKSLGSVREEPLLLRIGDFGD